MDAKQRRAMIPLIAVVVVLCIVIVVLVVVMQGRSTPAGPASEPAQDSGGGSNLVLDYAQGVTVVDDESSLQAAVDKMMEDASKEMVASYQNQAISEDGKTFTCYIANSEYNEYDMFIALYTEMSEDAEPIFLSGLMRPGEAYREITLDEALDEGTHRVNLAMTQVEDDHSTIHGQSVVTIDMVVQ